MVTNNNVSSTPILTGPGVTSVGGLAGSGTGIGSTTASGAKGSEYDATGGNVDDRSLLQKGKDAIKPGSQVGQHGNK